MVYMYLSVAFIQMLKAAAPASVLLTGYAFGTDHWEPKTFTNVCVIVTGVMIASYGELAFSMVGFLYQLGGLIFESVRLIMVQKLLNPVNASPLPGSDEEAQAREDDGKGIVLERPNYKMCPLVSLYYYAPVCALMNAFVALIVEVPTFESAKLFDIGLGWLLLNAAVAFMLNVASVFLIGKTSSLVLTLCGVLKNCGIVFASILLFGTIITPLQWLGYSIATLGLIYYSLGWEGCKQLYENGQTYWEMRGDKLRGKNLTMVIGVAAVVIVLLVLIWSRIGIDAVASSV